MIPAGPYLTAGKKVDSWKIRAGDPVQKNSLKTKRMKKYLYNPISIALAAVLMLVFFGTANSEAGTKDFNPFVKQQMETMPQSTVLHFRTGSYDVRNTDVFVKVRTRDKDRGKVMYQTYMTHVNGDGEGNVMVKNLMPATDYNVKIRVRKHTISDYSEYSNSRNFMTKAMNQ